MNIEHGTFTPLVFSVTGVMGKECSVFHKHIADKIARKTEQSYNDVISVIRCKLSFLILRSALLCIRGSRSHTKYEPVDDDLSLIFVKARMQNGLIGVDECNVHHLPKPSHCALSAIPVYYIQLSDYYCLLFTSNYLLYLLVS